MKIRALSGALVLILGFNAPAHAISDKTWGDISDLGVYTLLGSSLGVPAVKGDWEGFRQASYSLGAAEGFAIIGKSLVHEQRPDHSDNHSFPSGHASVAFASTTTLYRRYGWEMGLPAYALATVTAGARVAARKHHWYDVIAGAAIGAATGWYFTDPINDKVAILPWVDPDAVGVSFAMTW